MSNATNTNSDDPADEPQLRVADDALLERLRARTEPADDDEPLVLRLIRFTGADLRGVNLSKAEIVGSIFDSADLADARFVGTLIEACSFVAAKLPRTVFTDAELSLVNFTHADLESADFRDVTLDDVDVRDADLSKAIFDSGASGLNFLEAAVVEGMDLTGIDDDDMDGVERVQLFSLGAKAHSGFRCPVCVQWFPSD